MSIPTYCTMPAFSRNVEGLRNHSLVLMFVREDIGTNTRRWREWLVHVLLKATRHYASSRELLLQQLAEKHRPAAQIQQGRQLPILDFSLEMEDCITSLYKAIHCVRGLGKILPAFAQANAVLAEEKAAICEVRNQQEHMQGQIASGQVGDGPIKISFDASGEVLRFRDLKLPVVFVHSVLDHLFEVVASLFPNFNPQSAPQAGGTLQISIEATITEVRLGEDKSGKPAP